MKAICVDDEELILNRLVSLCREIPAFTLVEGFSRAEKALHYFDNQTADIAFLDIDMPDMNGILLAQKIKLKSPNTSIVFITGYSQYAVEAFHIHATGYLLKPVDKEQIIEEVENIKSLRLSPATGVTVQTFGNFTISVNGKVISFPRARSKEILAYLVDKRGSGVSRAELAAAIWENDLYDHAHQKQLDVYIRSLRNTLADYGAEQIFEMQRGILRVVPETFNCDFYRFLDGDPSAVNSFNGEYMSAYSWASFSEASLLNKLDY